VRVASESVVRHPAVADQLLAKIEEISKIFWETKQG
jgi:hypothetical protein